MKTTKLVLVAAFSFFSLGTVMAQEHNHDHAKMDNSKMATQKEAAYGCSMKCEGDKTYDKPGSCPKCGMTLVKQEKMAKTYTCSMHPDVKSNKPGDCPKCGMKLTEKKMEMKKSSDGHNHSH